MTFTIIHGSLRSLLEEIDPETSARIPPDLLRATDCRPWQIPAADFHAREPEATAGPRCVAGMALVLGAHKGFLSLPSGKRLHDYGKSPFFIGKLTIDLNY